MARLVKDRTGEIGYNKYGSKMEIIQYTNYNNILVKFENGNLVEATYQNFCNGKVRSVYDKTVLDVGFIGDGKYKPSLNKELTKLYTSWRDMIYRCYDEKFHKKQPTYKDVFVCDQWHNFQNFATWYEDKHYTIEGEKVELDKDILIKGNKVYSPETCIFVPRSINTLFVKCDAKRGNLPIGVHYCKRSKKFRSQITKDGIGLYLGLFDTPEEAFFAYKKFKEVLIQEKAELYKEIIPIKLYEVMMNYKVEISD